MPDATTLRIAIGDYPHTLPLKRGRAGTMTHDYKRNGTIDLFAAMNLATGEVLTDLRKGHAGADVLRFFKQTALPGFAWVAAALLRIWHPQTAVAGARAALVRGRLCLPCCRHTPGPEARGQGWVPMMVRPPSKGLVKQQRTIIGCP